MVAIGRGELDEHSDASRGSRVDRALVATVTAVAGIALLSCSATQPSAVHSSPNPTVFEPLAPIARAPLSAPVGFASPSPVLSSANTSSYQPAGQGSTSLGKWQNSPRWAAIKGDGCIVVDRESAAQAQAATLKVTNCSKE
jgi:hypothetical protein